MGQFTCSEPACAQVLRCSTAKMVNQRIKSPTGTPSYEVALNTAAAPVKVFPADTRNKTKLTGDVTTAIIVVGNRPFPGNNPVQWD